MRQHQIQFLKSQNTGYDSIKAESQGRNWKQTYWSAKTGRCPVKQIVRDILALWITNAHHAALWKPTKSPNTLSVESATRGCLLLYNWSLRKCIYNRTASSLLFLIMFMWDIFIYSMYSVLALSSFLLMCVGLSFSVQFYKLNIMLGLVLKDNVFLLFCE